MWRFPPLVAQRAERVIIWSDSVSTGSSVKARLTRRDFDVTSARSGPEAIRIVRDRDFDVAVVDLKMEGMDGIELLRILKQMLPDLQVIMLTGHGSEQAAREGIESGAFDYLSKPCELEELLKKIRAAARGRR